MLRLPSALSVAAIVALFKLLTLHCYRSTDFEVHRNWLAITHSLPLSQWYYANHSQWTLDYPPAFAYFEYLLSLPAALVDKKIVQISSLQYDALSCVAYQRATVVFTELLFMFAALRLGRLVADNLSFCPRRSQAAGYILAVLLITNAGLFLVDNIHFQYNAFLFGILLFSVEALLRDQCLLAGVLFALLLNCKHIFLYMAPAFFCYLFRSYCFRNDSGVFSGVGRLVLLGSAVIGVFVACFAPFYYTSGMDGLVQIATQLFPFRRGLTHAYWAPNFYALYNAADFGLLQFAKRAFGSYTRVVPGYITGLVQEFDHIVLPTITPQSTFLFLCFALAPFNVGLCLQQHSTTVFLRFLVYSAFTFYMFAWHVHEKAILMVIVPLTILAVQSRSDARIWLILSLTGIFSLFPLLFTPFEILIRNAALLSYAMLCFAALSYLFPDKRDGRLLLPLCSRWESFYLYGLVLIEFADLALRYFYPQLVFAPLMLRSVYCAFGHVYCYLAIGQRLLRDISDWEFAIKSSHYIAQERHLARTLITDKDLNLGPDGLVAAVDIQCARGDDSLGAVALVVLDVHSLDVVHQLTLPCRLPEDYRPGFLGFRERQPMLAVLERAENIDAVLVDGNGLLHPRRFGLACHVGALSGLPTIGVAKNLHLIDGLTSSNVDAHLESQIELIKAGESIKLYHEDDLDTPLGLALRCNASSRHPVYVSVGHQIDLRSAESVVRRVAGRHRIPEPLRLADQLARSALAELEAELWHLDFDI